MITELIEDVGKVVMKIAFPLLQVIGAAPIVVAFIVFIINNG